MRRAFLFAAGVFVVCGALALKAEKTDRNTSKAPGLPPDVIFGTPRPIPYARAFPLLDGIIQDIAAI